MNKAIMNPTRPEEAIQRILAHFPPAKPFLLESGKTFKPGKVTSNPSSSRTYFLLEGMMMCSLGAGEAKQNFCLVKGPAILNMASNYIALDCSTESVTPCLLDSVPYMEFRRVIAEHNLWEDLCEILALRVQLIAMRAMTNGLQSAYEIIRGFLIYMDIETTYNLKQRYTVVKYMQTFTHISRSMILKILSELKSGEFIEIENGKLVRICRTLPEKF